MECSDRSKLLREQRQYLARDEPTAMLLKAFVDEYAHMAVVQDEGGTAIGLVTLEDLVEEFVGELEDEFDRLPRMIHALSGGVWMIGGGVLVDEVNRKLGLSLHRQDGRARRAYRESSFNVPDALSDGVVWFMASPPSRPPRGRCRQRPSRRNLRHAR